MKTNYFLAGLLIMTFSIKAIAKDDNRHPRGKHKHHHHVVERRVVVVPPPPRRVVIVPPVPPPPVVVVAPRPRAVVRVGAVYAERPISSREAIRNAKRMIEDQRFEADRLRIAKDAAHDLPMKTVDVLDILQMFTYESSRLDFAKFAYSRTVDPENYSIVFEAFKYTGSIRDLEDYMYDRDGRR
jgi:hypothetical protein